jgi:hypothetical protein
MEDLTSDFIGIEEALLLLPIKDREISDSNRQGELNEPIKKGGAIVARKIDITDFPYQSPPLTIKKQEPRFMIDYENMSKQNLDQEKDSQDNVYKLIKNFNLSLNLALNRHLKSTPTPKRLWLNKGEFSKTFDIIGIVGVEASGTDNITKPVEESPYELLKRSIPGLEKSDYERLLNWIKA